MSKIEKAKKYAVELHSSVNQTYGGLHPYSYHLEQVVDHIEKFKDLIPRDQHKTAIASGWCHDLIEDTQVNYSDIKKYLGYEIAEIVFLLTDYKGRTRAERKPDKYWKELGENRLAVFIKLCDIAANFSFSSHIKGNYYMTYKRELKKVKTKLYKPDEFEPVWEYLENL